MSNVNSNRSSKKNLQKTFSQPQLIFNNQTQNEENLNVINDNSIIPQIDFMNQTNYTQVGMGIKNLMNDSVTVMNHHNNLDGEKYSPSIQENLNLQNKKMFIMDSGHQSQILSNNPNDEEQTIDDCVSITTQDYKKLEELLFETKLLVERQTRNSQENQSGKKQTEQILPFRYMYKPDIQHSLRYINQVIKVTAKEKNKIHQSSKDSKSFSQSPGQKRIVTQYSVSAINSSQGQNNSKSVDPLGSSQQYIEIITDYVNDSQAEINLKENVARILTTLPKLRSKENLYQLGKFMVRYKFFEKLKNDNSIEIYTQLMKAVKIMHVEKDQFIINQGDEGDRFYIIMKGLVSVFKAFLFQIPQINQKNEVSSSIYSYIYYLMENYQNVFWQKVPYSQEIKQLIRKLIIKNKKGFQSNSNSISSDDKKQMSFRLIIQKMQIDDKVRSVDEIQMHRKLQTIKDNFPLRLYNRLFKLYNVFDFSQIVLNQKVAQLKEGTEFGELALNYDEQRQASIVTETSSLFLYIEREEYKKILKRATQKEVQQKMQFLKAFRIFTDVSTSKLSKISYNMKKIVLVKNQVLYKENDFSDGIYLIQSGSLKYMKNVPYETPIESTTKNSWFIEQVKQIGVNKHFIQRKIAVFQIYAMVGFEEIVRTFILSERDYHYKNIFTQILQSNQHQDHLKSQKKITELQRDFTCVCESISAEVLFLSIQNFMPLIKMHEIQLVENLFKERRHILQKTLIKINELSDRIAGTGLEPIKTSISNSKFQNNQNIQSPNQEQKFGRSQLSTLDSQNKRNNNFDKIHFQNESLSSTLQDQNSFYIQSLKFKKNNNQKIKIQNILNNEKYIQEENQKQLEKNDSEATVRINHNSQDKNQFQTFNSDFEKNQLSSNSNLLDEKTFGNIQNRIFLPQIIQTNQSVDPYNLGHKNLLSSIQSIQSNNSYLKDIINENDIQKKENQLAKSLQNQKQTSTDSLKQNKQNNYQNQNDQNNSRYKSKMKIKNPNIDINNLNEVINEIKLKQDIFKQNQSLNHQTLASNLYSSKAQKIHQTINSGLMSMMGSKNFKKEEQVNARPVSIKSQNGTRRMIVAHQKDSYLTNRMQNCVQNQFPSRFNNSSFTKNIQSNEDKHENKNNKSIKFEFSQDIKRENAIDEKMFEMIKNSMQLKTDDDNISIFNQFSVENPLEMDSSHLYLKDVKNFMSLKYAKQNFELRREIENNYLTQNNKNIVSKDNQDASLVLKTLKGSSIQKTIYEGVKDIDINDKVTTDLNLRLINVFQSIDTKKYYQIKQNQQIETEQEYLDRINRSVENLMNKIDEGLNYMDQLQKHEKKQKKKVHKFIILKDLNKQQQNHKKQVNSRYSVLFKAKKELLDINNKNKSFEIEAKQIKNEQTQNSPSKMTKGNNQLTQQMHIDIKQEHIIEAQIEASDYKFGQTVGTNNSNERRSNFESSNARNNMDSQLSHEQTHNLFVPKQQNMKIQEFSAIYGQQQNAEDLIQNSQNQIKSKDIKERNSSRENIRKDQKLQKQDTININQTNIDNGRLSQFQQNQPQAKLQMGGNYHLNSAKNSQSITSGQYVPSQLVKKINQSSQYENKTITNDIAFKMINSPQFQNKIQDLKLEPKSVQFKQQVLSIQSPRKTANNEKSQQVNTELVQTEQIRVGSALDLIIDGLQEHAQSSIQEETQKDEAQFEQEVQDQLLQLHAGNQLKHQQTIAKSDFYVSNKAQEKDGQLKSKLKNKLLPFGDQVDKFLLTYQLQQQQQKSPITSKGDENRVILSNRNKKDSKLKKLINTIDNQLGQFPKRPFVQNYKLIYNSQRSKNQDYN